MNKPTVIAAVTLGLASIVGIQEALAQDAPSAPSPSPEPTEPPSEPSDPIEPEPTEPTTPEPQPIDPEPAAGPPLPSSSTSEGTLFPQATQDAQALQAQGDERPKSDAPAVSGSPEIFAEDWWSHARPVFEFHGYFRTRATLFHNFFLGRIDAPGQGVYPPPSDYQYTAVSATGVGSTSGPSLCDDTESDEAALPGTPGDLRPCNNKTQRGANMRFRLEPTLHISDNLRVNSQIDILDNVSFGTTPEGYGLRPAGEGGGYEVVARNGYLPGGYLDSTQVPPTSGVNGLEDSIRVKRAWAEFTTPVGELRFGRMPNHWGLGMVANAGDGVDDDAQSTVDRIMFASGVKLLDLTIAGMLDFPNEGPTYRSPVTGSEPIDRAQLDDVNQYGLILLRATDPELTKLRLARQEVVFNAGLYLNYRSQVLANDQPGNTGANVPGATDADLTDNGFSRRGLSMWRPDVWLQLLYEKLRVELEVAAVLGSVESTSVLANNGDDFDQAERARRKFRQYGFAFELQQKLVEDRLRLNFNTGWASGDPDAFDVNTAGDLIPGSNEEQVADDTISTFRFHPSYRVDLILNRYILQRVQGVYYFNPSLEYDFTAQPNGQRFGGGLGFTWTRSSEEVQSPGHAADLGVELGASLYFQSKDGALNDDPLERGGFFGKLQYAVVFPFDGMNHLGGIAAETSAAQALRLFLGAMF